MSVLRWRGVLHRLGHPLVLSLWLVAGVSVAAGATALPITVAVVLVLTVALVLTDDEPLR